MAKHGESLGRSPDVETQKVRVEGNESPPAIHLSWRSMDTAPRDGTWVLLDVDDGSGDWDEPWSSIHVGRWSPKVFPEIGPHQYEWETIAKGVILNSEEEHEPTDHWSEGRVCGWMPMPATAASTR